MSRLDQILTRLPSCRLKSLKTCWTVTKTDHAAVIATLEQVDRVKLRNGHVKLCNNIVTNPYTLAELREYLIEQAAAAVELNMNPHKMLEFMKM